MDCIKISDSLKICSSNDFSKCTKCVFDRFNESEPAELRHTTCKRELMKEASHIIDSLCKFVKEESKNE